MVIQLGQQYHTQRLCGRSQRQVCGLRCPAPQEGIRCQAAPAVAVPPLEKLVQKTGQLKSAAKAAELNLVWQEGAVQQASKERLLNQRGCVVFFTGLSGSGKSTVACCLEHTLHAGGHLTALLDGDNVRHGLNSNLTFSEEDRKENIRRVGEVSKLMMDAGLITLVSFISPFIADRESVRSRMKPGTFIEIFMKVPIEICEERDCKGLYKMAREGKIKNFTGIDSPYEAPLAAEIEIEARRPDGSHVPPQVQADKVVAYLEEHGFIPKAPKLPMYGVTNNFSVLDGLDFLTFGAGI